MQMHSFGYVSDQTKQKVAKFSRLFAIRVDCVGPVVDIYSEMTDTNCFTFLWGGTPNNLKFLCVIIGRLTCFSGLVGVNRRPQISLVKATL